MKPWSHDADDYNPNELPTEYILRTTAIEQYLESHSHERKFFLIGSKGTGKTLLLRYKAYLYWKKSQKEDQQGYRVSASNELVESLNFNLGGILSKKELERLANLNTWISMWKFAITLIAIRRLKIEFPDYLKDLEDQLNTDFPSNYRLNDIITDLMVEQKKYLASRFFRNTTRKISPLLNELKFPFVLFIDRLDQALDSLLSDDEYAPYYMSKKKGNLPFKVWQYAQFSLLQVGYDFATSTNKHIKLFATARLEALNVGSSLIANVKNYCVHLEYSKAELRQIFENNIKLTDPDRLNPDAKEGHWLDSFFGFNKMAHLSAKDEDRKPQVEGVFDFVCRHTFERPREIVMIGKAIHDSLLSPNFHKLPMNIKVERVRTIANEISHNDILGNYKKEVIPMFNEEYLAYCANSFKQNLIPRSEMQAFQNEEFVHYLYRIGLIGFVRKKVQYFLPASKFIHDESERLQQARYYLLHPSIDKKLQQSLDFQDFYNVHCIIGKDYPFPEPPIYNYVPDSSLAVEHFIPAQIPGKGPIEERWATANILINHRDLFEHYFTKESNKKRLKQKEKNILDAFDMLQTIATITAIRLVKAEFRLSENTWREEEDGLLQRLQKFEKRNEYSKKIKSLSGTDLNAFENRIFGRVVSAGMLIYLKTNYFAVRNAVRYFKLPEKVMTDKEEGAVKFLRQAFFLGNLSNNRVPEHTDERRKLIEGLSPFERILLQNWWLRYKEHVIFERNYFEEEHVIFLKKKMGMTL